MKYPKCGKGTLYFLPFQFPQIVLQRVISVVSRLNQKYLGKDAKMRENMIIDVLNIS